MKLIIHNNGKFMKLYYTRGACSLAVRISIHEMGIPCEFESVDLKEKKTEKGADYFKINAKGSVPALQLSNGELLTENAVIQQYLADTHKATTLLPAIGDMRRYRVLEWLNFISTDLHKNCSPLFNSQISDDLKETIFKPILKSKLTIADQHLQNHKFFTGDQVALCDGYLFVVLNWAVKMKIDLAQWPNLSRFFADMKQRKSVQQALSEEGIS